MRLKTIPGTYAVARLAPDAPIPGWADGAGFSAIVRSDDELTIVCLQDRVPQGTTSEPGWRCFRSLGPFAFDETGIVASLISPVSKAGIGVFVVCTFDGEHILVPDARFAEAQDVLTAEGHHFVEA